MQSNNLNNCALNCLRSQDDRCWAYEFNESNKVCKLSDQAVQMEENYEYSTANVYTGTANRVLSSIKSMLHCVV